MAVVDGFEHDLFLSYSWKDDDVVLENWERGWVGRFRKSLGKRLEQIIGKPMDIWWDKQRDSLPGNVKVEILVDSLKQTTALVAILSRAYLESKWCKLELEEFQANCRDHSIANLGPKHRIFKVLKARMDLDEQPEPIRNLLGYEFFRWNEERSRSTEMFQDKVDGRDYLERLDDLVHDIRDLFELAEGAGPKGVVFVAEVSEDLRAERDEIVRYLKQDKVQVLPEEPLPLSGARLRSKVREVLEKSAFSIHLLGGEYGLIPQGEEVSLEAIQLDLALSGPLGSGRRLVWHPESLSDRQTELLAGFENRFDGVELYIQDLEKLKTGIKDETRGPQEVEQAEELGPGALVDFNPYIYLLRQEADLEASARLRETLEHEGLVVVEPLCDDEEKARKSFQETYLGMSIGAVLFWGGGATAWCQQSLLALRVAARSSQRGSAGPLALGVYLAPGNSPEKDRFRARDAAVFDGRSCFPGEALARFVEDLKARVFF